MRIDFTVRSEDRTLTSDEALQHVPDLSEHISRPWDLEGAWTLSSADLELSWDDTLVPLVQTLLEAVHRLVTTGHAVASRTAEYGYLRMDVEGDWVRLGGDGLASGRVSLEPFVLGQLGCAKKLVSLLLALGHDGFDARALREDLREAARAWSAWKPAADAPDVLVAIAPAAPRRDAEGAVRLESGETLALVCGAERFVFPGDPHGWVTTLVEKVQPVLDGDAHLVLPLSDRYGYLRIDGEGDRVRLSGDGLGDLRLPLDGLLGTLANVALA